MIEVNQTVIEALTAHAGREYPHECGGMLIGEFSDGAKRVVESLPLANAREEEARHDRILILPKDVLRAERNARERGLEIVGYYHSHPDDSAVPSQYDLDHALPVWSYIIISVRDGKAADLRSWVMENDRSRFVEEEIEKQQAAAKV